jgi:fumarylacetoacetase
MNHHTSTALNATHDLQATSWVLSANRADGDFPIQNLPFAVFRHRNSQEAFRGGIAIGDQVLDLWDLHRSGLLDGLALEAAEAASEDSLNALMELGCDAWHALRHAVFELLHSRASTSVQQQVQLCLEPQAEVVYALPAHIGDYTDFYTSIHHATHIGKLFRPDNPLLPNYTWVPIGYHGRASSIQLSGHAFKRPSGQILPAGASEPVFSPCQRLDWEVELAVFMGTGNALGEPIPLGQTESHVFGVALFNDWSARDIQAWEYQPLGPFLSKSFASTLSPWIVTMEALAPYRTALARPNDKADLAYLHSEHNRQHGALDIHITMGLRTAAMREAGAADHEVSRSNYRHAYWTLAQMVAHHTVNGCNLQPGDVLGTGTLSGPTLDQAGALIELTQGGKVPLTLPNGETRTFLLDGDEAVMRAWCERPGAARIGFGECRATVLPAAAPQLT